MPSRANKAARKAVTDPVPSSSASGSEDIVSVEGGSGDESGEEGGSGSESGSSSGNESEEDDDDKSDSDSLDSSAPRKRRRISPRLGEDDDDEEQVPKVPVSFISAPSRIKKNVAADAQANPQKVSTSGATPPADVLGGVTTAPTDPNTSFESLGVHPWLVQSLSNMAIKRPTGIQKGCIPEILKGRDCIGGSRTGSGKTVAFAVPILQRWAEDPSAIFAVVLTPTRYVEQRPALWGYVCVLIVF